MKDSPAMRQLIVFAIKRIPGMRVVEAQDGLDGLSKLSAGWFDLVIIDINMQAFLAHSREACIDDDPIPAYVERTFRKYLECAIPAFGVARARCATRTTPDDADDVP
jgi:CheY-like chemotaxis protein